MGSEGAFPELDPDVFTRAGANPNKYTRIFTVNDPKNLFSGPIKVLQKRNILTLNLRVCLLGESMRDKSASSTPPFPILPKCFKIFSITILLTLNNKLVKNIMMKIYHTINDLYQPLSRKQYFINLKLVVGYAISISNMDFKKVHSNAMVLPKIHAGILLAI